MEQNILTNTETIIASFNDKFLSNINNKIMSSIKDEKEKIINDFKNEIRDNFMKQFEGDNETIFPDKNITRDSIKAELIPKFRCRSEYDINNGENSIKNVFKINKFNFKPKEYIINYKYEMNSNEINFLMFLTNFGSLGWTINIERYEFNKDERLKRGYTRGYQYERYVGKYKMPDELLYILNEFINMLFGINHEIIFKHGYLFTDNISITTDNIRKLWNIQDIINKIQTDYFLKPIIRENSIKQKDVKKDEIELIECVICIEKTDELYALVPCGHTNICTSCYDNQKLSQCPVCRKDISMRIKIYK